MEIFQEEVPVKDSWQGKLRVSKVAMISIDVNLGPQKHRAEFMKCFDNRQEFFLDSGVVVLSRSKLARVISNQNAILQNN
jgi:hypothetical protein